VSKLGFGPRGAGKNSYVWQEARGWAYNNPGKKVAIVAPEGHYEITFTPAPKEKFVAVEFDQSHDWVKKRFTEDL
jgi:hypothetical protein